MPEPHENEAPGGTRWWWRALQLLGSAAGFLYIGLTVDLGAAWETMRAVSWWHLGAAMALTGGALVVGALRWRVLLAAYGAPRRPSVRRLAHVYLIGFFYNTYLPGGVGGDLVRGVVTRQAFGDEAGASRAIAVVFIERLLGLAALLSVVAFVIVVAAPPGLEGALPLALLAIVGIFVGLALLALGARWASGRPEGGLTRLLRRLPELRRGLPFVGAYGLSLGTQSLVALTGYAVLLGVAPEVTLAQAFVIVPVAAASAFLPFTVGGAGAREAAFVELCALTSDIDGHAATAAALLVWCTQLAVAGLGGIVQVLRPLRDASQ